MTREFLDMGVRCRGFARYRFSFMGWERTFRLYTPEGLEDQAGVPLLITLHGGDHARNHERFTWHVLAEEKKFLVLYPESLRDGIQWNVWGTLGEEDGRADDVAYLNDLLDKMTELFGADPRRIYLHGQSSGDMFGSYYCFLHPDRVAAAFLCSGPTKTKYWMTPQGERCFEPAGPCPVMRLHGEDDVFSAEGLSSFEAHLYKQQCHVEQNSDPWLRADRCAANPRLFVNPERNAAVYRGEDGCDFVDLFTKNGVHRPLPELERIAWECFFTAYRLEDGKHVRMAPERGILGETDTVAVAAGSGDFLCGGQRVKTGAGSVEERDGELYLDCEMGRGLCRYLKEEFPADAERKFSETVRLPFGEFMAALGYETQVVFGVGCASRKPFCLTFDLACTVKRVLGLQRMLTGEEAYRLEDGIYDLQKRDHGFSEPSSREEEVWQWIHVM